MPPPTYTFTIPSLDGLQLDCRLYHPKWDQASDVGSAGADFTKYALIAHPYAPLGGSYDDSVVEFLTAALLRNGYIVGTFNFRGAPGSKGSTSWTGKAERDDCVAFAAFMLYYSHFGREETRQQQQNQQHSPNARDHGRARAATLGSAPVAATASAASLSTRSGEPDLCLAGYSYGSLVISRLLPSVGEIVKMFESSPVGTVPAEIVLRARRLAIETVEAAAAATAERARRERRRQRTDHPNSPSEPGRSSHVRVSSSPVVALGGYESDIHPQGRHRPRRPHTRDGSSIRRRSVDVVRKAAEIPHRVRTHIRRHSSNSSTNSSTNGHGHGHGSGSGGGGGTISDEGSARQMHTQTQKPASTISTAGSSVAAVSVRYLLISPLLPPLTYALCIPWLPGSSSHREVAGMADGRHRVLAIFGSDDTFTSAKRLKSWATRQARDRGSLFRWAEIEHAGHFWREDGALDALQQNVTTWLRGS